MIQAKKSTRAPFNRTTEYVLKKLDLTLEFCPEGQEDTASHLYAAGERVRIAQMSSPFTSIPTKSIEYSQAKTSGRSSIQAELLSRSELPSSQCNGQLDSVRMRT